MRSERGFVMGIVLMGILVLSLAGATAVLLSSAEIDMSGAMRQRRQLEACSAAAVDAQAANMPDPKPTMNTPWAVDPNRPAAQQQYVATQAHYAGATLTGVTLNPAVGELSPEAASAIKKAANVGGAIGNRTSAGGTVVYRLLSTCAQRNTGATLETEGVYVYNPN